MKVFDYYSFMKENKRINEEVSGEVYSLISNEYSNSRIVLNARTNSSDNFSYIPTKEQKSGMKPNGLWYSFGTEWIDWVRENMPEWERKQVFVIKVNESRVLKISSFEELLEFEDDYAIKDVLFYSFGCPFEINWSLVSEKWGGIEINPYIYRARPRIWYNGWDVASGCVWGDGMVLDIEKFE